MAIGPARAHEFTPSTFDRELCEDCGNRERQDPHVEDMAAIEYRRYRDGLSR